MGLLYLGIGGAKMTKIKYYFWLGTAAEWIKMRPLLRLFITNSQEFRLIATGQNNLLNNQDYVNDGELEHGEFVKQEAD